MKPGAISQPKNDDFLGAEASDRTRYMTTGEQKLDRLKGIKLHVLMLVITTLCLIGMSALVYQDIYTVRHGTAIELTKYTGGAPDTTYFTYRDAAGKEHGTNARLALAGGKKQITGYVMGDVNNPDSLLVPIHPVYYIGGYVLVGGMFVFCLVRIIQTMFPKKHAVPKG